MKTVESECLTRPYCQPRRCAARPEGASRTDLQDQNFRTPLATCREHPYQANSTGDIGVDFTSPQASRIRERWTIQ